MNEKLSRFLFIVEFIIFALPALYILAAYAVLFGAWCLYGVIAMLGLVATQFNQFPPAILTSLGAVAAFSASIVVAVAGLVALWKFLAVSWVFTFGGRAKLIAHRARFYNGLLWGILPLCVVLPVVVIGVDIDHPISIIVIAYVTGFTLLIPVTHLWAELRKSTAL